VKLHKKNDTEIGLPDKPEGCFWVRGGQKLRRKGGRRTNRAPSPHQRHRAVPPGLGELSPSLASRLRWPPAPGMDLALFALGLLILMISFP